MASKSFLFSAYDPLLKTAPLFIWKPDNAEKSPLSLRPVCLIGDLAILYDWLNAASGKTNWAFDLNRQTLFLRYKNYLLSNHAQSFMIEQDQKPVIQFDLLLRPQSVPASPTRGNLNCQLLFLFNDHFRNRDIFKMGLQCLLAYLFSLPETGNIYLRLFKSDMLLSTTLTGLRFEPVRPDLSGPDEQPMYRITNPSS